jgi:hypothetical protein
MKLEHITYTGPASDDAELLDRLPEELADLLRQINGFIQFHGGLHLRGACKQPAWHSLRAAWLGKEAFHRLYPAVEEDDIPFAEDCLGDQFLLRDDEVWKLSAETGDVESLEVSFDEFLEQAQDDPVEFLGLHPLLQFQQEGGALEPGQLLSSYPPFCTEQADDGVRLNKVSTLERHRFLARLAAKIRALPEGAEIDVSIIEDDQP